MGSILSLNRRHCNFDPAASKMRSRTTPTPSRSPTSSTDCCLWAVAGELPAGARCPWDSVAFAGVWLPDAETLESARNYGGWTRRHFMRKRARQACEAYTQWCNGDVYGYEVERVTACAHCGEETHGNAR